MLERGADTRTVIRLFPIVSKCVQAVPIRYATKLLVGYARKMGKRRIIAGLPAVVDLLLDRIDKITQAQGHEGVADVEDVLHIYDSFLGALSLFANPTGWSSIIHDGHFRSKRLPTPVLQEVLRIARHLLSSLDGLPWSFAPEQQRRLDAALLFRLFSPQFLSSELRDILLKHTREKQITLSSWHWHQCFLSAVKEGDETRARQFLRSKRSSITMQENPRLTPNAGTTTSAPHQDGIQPDMTASNATFPLHRTAQRKRERRDATQQSHRIDALLSATVSGSFAQLIESLEPYLQSETEIDGRSFRSNAHRMQRRTAPERQIEGPADPWSDGITPYAWSKLLSRAAKDRSIDSEQLLWLSESMPHDAVKGHTLVPVMQGLVQRGEAQRAWDIWRELVVAAKRVEEGGEGKYVDATALAVACDACQRISDFSAAITLVDLWARRRKAARRNGDPEFLHSIILDAQNVNVLLNLCKREGLASVAFRLWAAALPRWNVYPDDISLGLLIDTVRYSDPSESEDRGNGFLSSVRRLRDELSTRDLGKFNALDRSYEAYEANGFAKGSVTVLLDVPGCSWRKEHGDVQPWQLAREVFRDVVFGNWPHLADIKSPLDLQTGPLSYLSSFFGGQYPSAQPTDPRVHHRMACEDARYTHIIPSPVTFYLYIGLIGYRNLASEIPLVLAWMRDLDIRPTSKTMRWAMVYVAEAEGPSKRVTGWGPNGEAALLGDSQILRRWLVDWLGDGTEVHEGVERRVVPTEEDVMALRMSLMSRNKPLTASR